MIIEEFTKFKDITDKDNPFIPHYEIEEGVDFYIEPIFYTQLLGFKERHEDKYQLIIDSLIERVKKNKKVIFVGDFETNIFEKEGYIILEITDITDPLHIFVEDKSRGSDYGD